MVRRIALACLLVGLVLLAATSSMAQETPSIRVQANAPGWVTVCWEHSGQDVYYWVIERQSPPYGDSTTALIAQSQNRTDCVTDKNLRASTTYKYHVCAVYAYSRTCTDWVSVTTLAAPGTTPPSTPPGSSPPPYELRTPRLTATSNNGAIITLHIDQGADDLYVIGDVQIFRDGKITYDAVEYAGQGNGWNPDYPDGGKMFHHSTGQWTGEALQPNTQYTYKACLIGYGKAAGQIKCSNPITAMGMPVPPSAPSNVVIKKDRLPSANPKSGRPAAALTWRTVVSATWRAMIFPTDITPQFITLERLDSGLVRRGTGRTAVITTQRAPVWIELQRELAKPRPTLTTADVTPPPVTNLVKPGNQYRLCSVVPALGDKGKVCSPPVTLP